MYKPDDSIATTETPICWCIRSKANYLEKAISYFRQYDYAACATSLRKQCEQTLKQLLPEYQYLQRNDADGRIDVKDLSKYIDKLTEFYHESGIPNVTPRLNTYRQRVLNPLSHDNLHTPIYRSEVELAIKEVSSLCEIQTRVVIDYDKVETEEFAIHLDNAGNVIDVTFKALDRIKRFEYGGVTYFSNPRVKILTCTDCTIDTNQEYKLNKIFSISVGKCGYRAPGAAPAPSLYDSVTQVSTGNVLSAL